MKVTFLTALAQGAVLLVISPFVPHMVRISANAASMLRIMLLVNSVYQIGIMINTLLIASIFRCGGDSRYGMVLDILCMWFVAVPLGLISAFILKLPPLIVYLFIIMRRRLVTSVMRGMRLFLGWVLIACIFSS